MPFRNRSISYNNISTCKKISGVSFLKINSRELSVQTTLLSPLHSLTSSLKGEFIDDSSDDEYGWFSMDEEQDGPKTETGYEAIQRYHKECLINFQKRRVDPNVVHISYNSTFMINTRNFGTKSLTWGIAGFRIYKGPKGCFAQYHVITNYNGKTWSKWIRFSQFSQLAKTAISKGW
eukprot:CAMPEP_0171464154 /NCGR_PEP_ID=MMETSP0945-20130129/7561_1 /TAXON_ID=109269 /ORGANISM="Vaucheria litorea, Strain CCMP2940" /LENGTH=176 /DNA_ID=CAMNT_0011991135 /DNA_START=58 /DNA_END=585 /DNA_ORIENTATION=+